MHLKELLDQEDVTTRNVQLKKAFNALSELICIDGYEVQAIFVLANLTTKLSDSMDVTSQTKACSLLRSETWLSRCVNTAKFRHTHNLKYPDYKNRGVLRLEPIGELPAGYVSSQLCKGRHRLGWSQNSADINYQLFFCANFIWRGAICNIADLICLKNAEFQHSLHTAGMYKKDYQWIEKELQQITQSKTVFELGSELRQIRLPYHKNYCALTPVPAHNLQREIHLALKNERQQKSVTGHARAASVGDLVAAAAGKLFAFKTLPQKLRMRHTLSPSNQLPQEGLTALGQLIQVEQLLLTENIRKKMIVQWQQEVLQYIEIWMQRYCLHQQKPKLSAIVERFNVHLSKIKSGHHLAYRPEVTKLLNQLFSKIIDTNETASVEQVKSNFLLLPGIKVSGASAISSAYTVGLPSLIGIWGFLHAFERNVQRGTAISDFRIESFALCLHRFSLDNRGLTREAKVEQKTLVAPAILPTRYCDLVVSFVLKIKADDQQPEATQLYSYLPNSLCQGAVHPQIEQLNQSGYFGSFYQAALAILEKRGRWLLPNLDFSPVDVADVLTTPDVLLTTVGYQLLEKPVEKPGAVNNLPHAFAEPVIGQVRQYHASADAVEDEFFWKIVVLPNAFLLGVEGTEYETTTEI